MPDRVSGVTLSWSYAHRRHRQQLADRITRGTVRLLEYSDKPESEGLARAWARQIRADVDELCATIEKPATEVS